ncbi:type VI secretion system ImpA family N-terminal domain-containing protein [Celerinatantimonas sp. YJH-8]|uniref:type VI secretion system ImpA family N-terminal domain-containing protein n=1 Tax=Celerinatantimonas sp. YJH-8 TaxID=3228714 RepID=UPI0038C88CBF
MSQLFYSEGRPFILVDDERQLRESERYQQIRQAINQRFNPLSGGIQWQQVYDDCVTIALSEGVDLLVACYFTVAGTKLTGLPGLASGLELQLAVLDKFNQHSVFPPERRRELLQWQLARLTQDLKRLTPALEQLRDMYRCERACQQLDERLKQLQSEQSVELEALGYLIFEQIDRLENGFKQAPLPSKPTISPALRVRWSLLGIVIGVLLMVPWARFGSDQDVNPLLASVTQSTVQPQILSLNQGRALRAQFSDQQLHAHQRYLQVLYQQRSEQLLKQPFYAQQQQALALADTLVRIYPNDQPIKQFVDEVQNRSRQWQSLYQEQFTRFSSIRSRFANLEQAISRHQFSQAQHLASQLSDYVQSLSPVYGRLQYIRDLLTKQHYEQAQQQLDELNQRMNAIAFQTITLDQQLRQQRPKLLTKVAKDPQ